RSWRPAAGGWTRRAPNPRPAPSPETPSTGGPPPLQTPRQGWGRGAAGGGGKSPPPREEEEIAGTRPASASLCHALEEKLLALHARALAGLTGQEQRELRVERHRTREHLEALRCREAGGRSWF